MTATLVIGGTAGLGREVAQRCADRGEQVVIAGRDAARSQAVAAEIGSGTTGIAVDLAEPETIFDALAVSSGSTISSLPVRKVLRTHSMTTTWTGPAGW
jgi:short-subunit dehydrogenase